MVESELPQISDGASQCNHMKKCNILHPYLDAMKDISHGVPSMVKVESLDSHGVNWDELFISSYDDDDYDHGVLV
jgi:hypothetical protein